MATDLHQLIHIFLTSLLFGSTLELLPGVPMQCEHGQSQRDVEHDPNAVTN